MTDSLTERLATAARQELARTLSALCGEVGAAESSILLPANDTELLFFASSNPVLMRPDVPFVPINASFSGIAFRTGQTIAVADAANQTQHYKAIDERVATRTREFAAIPCVNGGVVGVLTLVNRVVRDADASAPFNMAEIRRAETFATEIAHAIGLLPGLVGGATGDADGMRALDVDFAADLALLTQTERRVVHALVSALIENRGA
jgi:hypothetical protein